MVTGGEEEEEETKRNKTSRRHQNLKASSSRGGPQFVKGNKSSATKYLHTCTARESSSRDGNSGQEEEEEEAEEGPEDETRPEEKKARGRGPRRVRDPQKLAKLPDKKQLEHESQNREAMQAGRPTTCNTVCGSAPDWWYRTVPKWTQAKWTHSTSALCLSR
ncbi:unnamed protein product [Sphagnum troendelagicum]|uniref:Uncharacterized protein n=1 Tax=Sphagnum troendelagicum TaxID=128251 RepID=A0ABP0U2C4_9BRYO